MLIFGITSAVVISSLAIALLYAKWYSSEDYTAMIVVYGEEAWDGAIVVVKGPSIAPNGLSAKLEADNNLMIRFHVPPGNYDVNIYKDGKPLLPQRRVTGLKADNWAWPYRQPSTTRKSTPAD